MDFVARCQSEDDALTLISSAVEKLSGDWPGLAQALFIKLSAKLGGGCERCKLLVEGLGKLPGFHTPNPPRPVLEARRRLDSLVKENAQATSRQELCAMGCPMGTRRWKKVGRRPSFV